MSTPSATPLQPISFETHPSKYRHIKLEIDGPIARILLDIQETEGMRDGYELKLNSYDLSVDIELNDAVNRLRFEHPEVGCVIVSSAQEGIFCSGANIFMLGSSTHAFKVNFCKYTNETRLGIEDSTENDGQTYIAGLNGIASGGGYELALACDKIYLVDDRRSAVALPEVPYLGVLPGTGGLTRVVDKRMIRRDRADIFCTLAEGLKGKKAKKWDLVDDIYPLSKFASELDSRAREFSGDGHPERAGIALEALTPEITEDAIVYRHLKLSFDPAGRSATLEIHAPTELPDIPSDQSPLDSSWYPLRMFRELDDALIRLRFNYPKVALVSLMTRGDSANVLKMDQQLADNQDNWFVRKVTHHIKRVLKRLDLTAKSFFALVDDRSCFAGTFLELAFAADRAYMLEDDNVQISLSEMNHGPYPMSNGLTRLHSRLLGEPQRLEELRTHKTPSGAEEAEELGLITLAFDDLDWDDEIRLATEERIGLSPDSLTGMEASLRFAGPETLETKIFGRLSAWQNWIFQRPNAVGPKGALTLYGQPESAEYDFNRT